MSLDNINEMRIQRRENPWEMFVTTSSVMSDSSAVSLAGNNAGLSGGGYYLRQDGWSGADAPQISATFTPSSAGQGAALTAYKVGNRNLVIPVAHNVYEDFDREPLDNALYGGTLGSEILVGVDKVTGQEDRFLLGCVYQGGFDRQRRNRHGSAMFRLAVASEWGYFVSAPRLTSTGSNTKTLNTPDMPGPVLWGIVVTGNASTGSLSISSNDLGTATLWSATRRPFASGTEPTAGMIILPGYPYNLVVGFGGTSSAGLPILPTYGLGSGRWSANRLPPYLEPNRSYNITLGGTLASNSQVFYFRNYASM